MNKDFIIFLAPNFLKMGIDLVNKYKINNPHAKIYILCHGPREVYNLAFKRLNKIIDGIWDIEEFENNCSLDDNQDLKKIDAKMGSGYLAKVISSDRSIGYGLVRGSFPRESHIKEKVKKNNFIYPSILAFKIFNYLEKIIDKNKPQVAFGYAVASAASLIFADLCKKNNITYTTIKSTRIQDYFFIDTDYMAKFEEINKEYNKKGRDYFNKSLSNKIYDEYYTNPSMPSYQLRKIVFINQNKILIAWLRFIKNFVKYITLKIINSNYEFFRVRRSFIEFYFLIKKNLISKNTFSKIIPKKKFIYFSLQVEPEASTSIFSPFNTDQISAIENLSKSAPSDMYVLVKENIFMLGRRSKDYYKIINKLPRVMMVSPYISAIDMIKKSTIVATITGTAAWEGLIYNKKVLVLGDSPYLVFNKSIIQASNPSKYNKNIIDLINSNNLEKEEVIKFIDCCISKSFKMDSGLIWRGDYDSFSKEIKQEAINNIYKNIESIHLSKINLNND